MAKDPAVLFYTQDFLIGVSLLSPLQKGHYITILCYQQQSESGALTEPEIRTLMGKDFSKHWPVIKPKFKEEPNGFYNDRMRKEIERRKQYSSRQKDRVDKRWLNHRITAVDTTVIPNNGNTFLETEIEIRNKGGVGENESPAFPVVFELSLQIPLPPNIQEAAEMNQVTMTGKKNTQFVRAQWLIFLHERISEKKRYKDLGDLTSHFLNWIRSKFPKKEMNESTAKTSAIEERSRQILGDD